jgi:hypothetical protein
MNMGPIMVWNQLEDRMDILELVLSLRRFGECWVHTLTRCRRRRGSQSWATVIQNPTNA